MSKKMVGCVCTKCNKGFMDEIETEQPPELHSFGSFGDLNSRIYKMQCFDCLTKKLAECFGEWCGRFETQRAKQRDQKIAFLRLRKKQKGKKPLSVDEIFQRMNEMEKNLSRNKATIDERLRKVAEVQDAAG